jgi:hypothetical protein
MDRINTVAVVIPTRTSPDQNSRIERALYTVFHQQKPSNVSISVYLGLDPGAEIPSCVSTFSDQVNAIGAAKASQASALNAALQATSEDLVMFLEDDDFWEQGYLSLILGIFNTMNLIEMVTSNQLEIDACNGEVVRINDFPTPSSWSLTRAAINLLGFFCEDYHYHLDNEYLGRASVNNIRRLHILERTAPITVNASRQVRPWISNVLTLSGGHTSVARHLQDTPYIIRTVRSSSRSSEVEDHAAMQRSRLEYTWLESLYGRVPW